MIKLPGDTKKHAISNSSDLFGTIHYGKNLNLDEAGYIKLAPRVLSLFAQNDGTNSSLRLPVALGRNTLDTSPEDSIDFAVTQAGQKGYWLTLQIDATTLNVDTVPSAPTLTADSHGCWYQNLWHATDDTEMYSKAGVTDVSVYTDRTAVSLTTGKVHDLAVFEDLNKIAVTNGNTVKLYDSSYTLSVTLTLPSDFEAVGLSYSNGKMAIITMLSDTATGKNQNKEAQFFVWDGVGTSAQPGIPVGASKIIAVAPYKGSWVILTSRGQLRFFNGGGWNDLAALPFYYQNLAWGNSYSRDLLGDVLLVEGDRIYINTNALLKEYGQRYEQFYVPHPGGVLCYDPAVGGIYHRYSPSISVGHHIQVAQAGVNTTTDIMTITAAGTSDMTGTIPPTGSPIKYVHDKTSPIGGLVPNTVYYVIKHNATTFSLATTKALAEAGTKVDLTSTGPANSFFYGLEVRDYGQSYANKAGAIADVGKVHPMWNHFLFGAELNDYDGTGNSNHLNVTVPEFENRGYFVTPKMQSGEIQDKGQKVFVKYRTLATNDSITVKVKDKDLLGLPISTPQATASTVNQCSWTGADAFSTTANLADAKTAFDDDVELECEVIAGAGAGVLVKISGMSESGGTYAVTLAEDVDGAASGRKCDVVIDNWKVLGTITSSDTKGYKTFNVGRSSTWFKYKVELRGSDTAVEEVGHLNSVRKPTA